MENPKSLAVLVALCIAVPCLLAQGLNTTASRDDWEEINFEFNSSVLSDGYPSLLRLADLLKQHPDYKVTLEGNTDWVGSDPYNDKLSRARAQTVRSFLVKYGAAADQILITAQGKRVPKVDNKTPEGRFMNRRVSMVVNDGQGRLVSAGGVGDAIKALQAAAPSQAAAGTAAPKQAECCGEILKRLDKLDEILAAVKELKAENQKLKQDVAALQQGQTGVQKQLQEVPKPPERSELAKLMEATVDQAIEKAKPSRFALLGLNFGPTLTDSLRAEYVQGAWSDRKMAARGNLTFTGKGRYFAPFGKDQIHALQAEGEYLYYRDRQEGQFDIGLVNRYNRMQMGLFSSIKHVNMRDLHGGGTLGQGALTVDYLFSRGRIGAFGTKGYLDERVIARTPVVNALGLRSFYVFDESYLKIVDQIGGSTQIGAWQDAYFDANFGAMFRHGGSNRPGGMIRLVQPINPRWAFTVEAGLNETLLGLKNTGRIVFGLQLGNWVRPKEFTQVTHAVPVEVPRLRYELLTRRVRTGNTPPVADAGPDQIGVAAGTITLNGSGSYDPDGDALTYKWDQIAGPTVSISGMNTAVATFPAAEGQSYGFRLTVKDTQGAQGIARTTVTITAPLAVRIVRFTANPSTIRAGQSTTLVWEVQNAETVEISDLGRVDARAGTSTLAPTRTTIYKLTARNRTSEAAEAVTVTVEQPQVRILYFQATPATITAGETSTLAWQTENAESVTISGIGDVAVNGSAPVSPKQTTSYTLTARNRYGEVSSTATVQVTPGSGPRIVAFSAAPPQILSGERATLVWQVENATSITISSIGAVSNAGTQDVSPATTTTYTLTASNPNGQVTTTAVVTVMLPVKITSFTAAPTSTAPGGAVVLTWTTENALGVSISGVGTVPANGSVKVNPGATTTYMLTATGFRSQDVAQATVQVASIMQGPICDAGPNMTTSRGEFFKLDASKSTDPSGSQVTFSWRVAGSKPATIAGGNTATPTVTFNQGYGEYVFEVTVTNAAGARCTATTRVNYIDP
jgi:hypothetical protein